MIADCGFGMRDLRFGMENFEITIGYQLLGNRLLPWALRREPFTFFILAAG
jgi:hypothetical protein